MKNRTNNKILILVVVLFFPRLKVEAQDTAKVHIDPSKPTNFYTRFSNNLEYTFRKAGNRFGYRGNFVWASKRQDHAVYAELPLLYATSTNKFGLSDMRFRYYWVPYRNYSKKPGAFGLALDAYAPTGKFENDLGMGRWIAAPGITTAFVFGNFSTFPVLSYLYCSGIMSDKVSAESKKELNGFIIQFVCVYKFSKKNYLDCTSYFIKNSYTNAGKDDFQVESNYLYMVKKNKLQVGGFVRRIFRGNVTTVRASVRLYL